MTRMNTETSNLNYNVLKKISKIIIFLFTAMSEIRFLVYNGNVRTY